MKLFLRRNQVWFEFALLALLIMGPLLLPGYILALDMVWAPHIDVPGPGDQLFVLKALMHGLSAVIGSMWVQKLILIVIVTMGAVGAYRLVQRNTQHEATAPLYLAGLLYLFNPWVYTRFVEGQFLVLAGYAVLPWAAAAVWTLLRRPSRMAALRALAWTVAVGLVSLHTIGILALLSLIMAIMQIRHWRRWLWWGLGVAAAWSVIMAVWLLPFVHGTSRSGQVLWGIQGSELAAYATRGEVGGVPLTAALLQGFWNDTSGTYVLPSSVGWWWYVAAALLAGLVVSGLVQVVRRRDRLGLALAAGGLAGWWLAMGVGWDVSASTAHWLAGHVPLYQGYREPGKWLMLLALAYAYLAAAGLGWGWQVLVRRGWPAAARAMAAVALILPVAFAPTLLFGAGRQLRAVDYPADWYAVNRQLDAAPGAFRVLVLPWHQYLPVRWAGRPLANPAGAFFDRPVVSSSDPELPGVILPPDSDNAVVQTWLLGAADPAAAATVVLNRLRVRYIIVLKESDWQAYGWLDSAPNLKLIRDSATLLVYQNVSPEAP